MRRPEPANPGAAVMAMAQMGIVLGLEFALPVIGGWALDRRLGSTPTLTLLGAVLGFAAGIWHLLRLARDAPKPRDPDTTPTPPR